ncbi:hypothetical protein BBP40_008930 [Aspergillus hancockii]|nr:hypothetical protein BBP40_008930 [Aspergillus hancockii]
MASTYQQWYSRQQFYTANDRSAQIYHARIADAVIPLFTTANALVERWPTVIRKSLNWTTSRPSQRTPEYDSWARPRELEKRKQAVSVWTSFLAFLTFHWHDYGSDGALEAMGLRLPWLFKDGIDTIHDYAESGRSQTALRHAIKGFLIQVITDAQATPQTNPLVWWLAILIQTGVLDDQPRWQVAQLQDTLDFSGKLEAVDHYARVLVLEYAFSRWLGDASPHGMSPAQKGQVVEALDEVSLDWLDRDEKCPPVDIFEELQEATSPEWRACTWYIKSILAQWLTVQTMGPMSTVVKLHHGESARVIQVKRYQVKAEIHENYTVEPLVAECYPALVATKTTIKKANQAAREYLREELGPKYLARKWDEVYETGGKIRIRAIYKDHTNNAKAIVWVEEILMDNEEINDTGLEI